MNSRSMHIGKTKVTLSWDGPISDADLIYAAGELAEPDDPNDGGFAPGARAAVYELFPKVEDKKAA